MATRGIVAIKQKAGENQPAWKGIYNHWDSYPEWLGKMLAEHLKMLKEYNNLKMFEKNLLKCETWPQYLEGGICEYCGEWGSPEGINMTIIDKGQALQDTKKELHSHSEKYIYTPDNIENYIEWVYVVDLKKYVIEVYKVEYDENEKGIKLIFKEEIKF